MRLSSMSRRQDPSLPSQRVSRAEPWLRILVIALVTGWSGAAWLAYRLLLARGRLLLDTPWVSSSTQHGTSASHESEERTRREFAFAEFGLRLGAEHAYFLQGLTEARLLKEAGAQFRRDKDDRLLCEIGGITVFVRSVEEMWILREIFVQGLYDVRMNGPVVVWDIGMNVGVASLYFAARGNTTVVGYEPIGSTYEMALENIALNPALRSAITTVNSGVGGSNRTEMVDFCDELKGSAGLFGAVGDPWLRHTVLHLAADAAIRLEALRLEDAASVFASIRAAHPHIPVMAKIDCEGAEYEIIEALHRSGDLSSLHAIILEWHRDGPEPLQQHLNDAGFTVFSLDARRGQWGHLYAVRERAG
jgi:FkbM family methyltransferase